MPSSAGAIPASLVLQWPAHPLSEAEGALHGSSLEELDRPLSASPLHWPTQGQRLWDSLIRVNEAALLAPVEHAILATIDPGVESRIPADVVRALTGDSTVAESERAPWEGGALDGIEGVQEAMRAHLEAPTAIPHEDLAFYLPWLDGDDATPAPTVPEHPPDEESLSQAVRSLFKRRQTLAGAPASDAVALPAWDPQAAARRRRREEADAAPPATREAPEVAPEQVRAPIKAEAAVGLKIQGLPPLPFLTAALEAIATDQDEYGFHLRYGRYAPEERLSQVTVGGLRLSEFSKRVAEWLEEHGAAKFPLQVIDDGSGELTVHLLD